MRITTILLMAFMCIVTNAQNVIDLNEKRAFVTAEGGGRFATGGRGGIIVEVTNLNDSGAGSLRAAIDQTVPRTIIFRVGGQINLSSTLTINDNEGDVTIAGETAPGDGITIAGNEFQIGGSNVIVRFIRSRVGAANASGKDAMRFVTFGGTPITDFMIDHVSLSWAGDENFSTGGGAGVENLTLQNSIMAENIGTNYALLLYSNSRQISIIKNLFVSHGARNIRSSDCSTDFEFVNNLIVGYTSAMRPTYENVFDMVGNVYETVPNITASGQIVKLEASLNNCPNGNEALTSGYISDNTLNGGVIDIESQMQTYMVGSKIFSYGTPVISSSLVKDKVLADVGANISQDAVDVRVIGNARNNTGALITTEASVGGYPTLDAGTPYTDADGDGMDDDWETLHGVTSRSDIKATYTIGGKTINNNANYSAFDIFLADRAGDFNRIAGGVGVPPVVGALLKKGETFGFIN